MARLATANDIINSVAVSVGLNRDNNPVSSADETFVQLTELLSSAGQEMVELHNWQLLIKSHQITTQASDSGEYDLPDDFSHMIDQTHWEHTNRLPMGGPLTPQDWTYLAGRNLVNQTIHVNFRILDNKFTIYPNNPVPDGLDLNFEYMSRNWVREANGTTFKDSITIGDDTVLYEPILIKRFLKAKFLEAKGFDATAAANEFENMFSSRTGKDTGAKIISAGGSRGYPYLDVWRNTKDTGYGL